MDEHAQRLVREFLDGREALCPGCGYNLRSLTEPRCPECNREIRLQIGCVEPRLGAFLAAVIGLAFGVGFSGLLLAHIPIALLMSSNEPPAKVFLFAGLPFLIECFCLCRLVQSRVWFRALPDTDRRLVAGGCWLLTIANVIFFSFIFD